MPTAITHDPVFTTPVSSTNTAVVRWSGTAGAVLQDSGVLIDGSNNITGIAGLTATQVDITGQGDLRLQDTTGGQYVALQAAGTTTTHTLTFPATQGSASTVLTNNGSGALTWAAASGSVTSKTYETTRTASSGTGNQDFTDAGFTPKAAWMLALVNGTQPVAIGMVDSGTNGGVSIYGQSQSSYPNIWNEHGYGFQVRNASNFMDCTPSLLSNGIRFAWTKYGSGVDVRLYFMLIG